MVKEAQIIYSPVYASCIDFNHCFYDCAYGKCHLSVFYQFHCTSVGFNSKFVFLDNYKYMFQDKDFLQALFNTFKLMLVIPALTIFLSLIFAFILTQGELREKSFYRTVFFFPSVVSMTVVGIVWSFVFNPTRGILNHMLDLFNLSSWKHAWLGEGKTALWCIGAA
ncbi:MAG: carbohydrate ABC transporter permease, partial [Blautia obeum]